MSYDASYDENSSDPLIKDQPRRRFKEFNSTDRDTNIWEKYFQFKNNIITKLIMKYIEILILSGLKKMKLLELHKILCK